MTKKQKLPIASVHPMVLRKNFVTVSEIDIAVFSSTAVSFYCKKRKRFASIGGDNRLVVVFFYIKNNCLVVTCARGATEKEKSVYKLISAESSLPSKVGKCGQSTRQPQGRVEEFYFWDNISIEEIFDIGNHRIGRKWKKYTFFN